MGVFFKDWMDDEDLLSDINESSFNTTHSIMTVSGNWWKEFKEVHKDPKFLMNTLVKQNLSERAMFGLFSYVYKIASQDGKNHDFLKDDDFWNVYKDFCQSKKNLFLSYRRKVNPIKPPLFVVNLEGCFEDEDEDIDNSEGNIPFEIDPVTKARLFEESKAYQSKRKETDRERNERCYRAQKMPEEWIKLALYYQFDVPKQDSDSYLKLSGRSKGWYIEINKNKFSKKKKEQEKEFIAFESSKIDSYFTLEDSAEIVLDKLERFLREKKEDISLISCCFAKMGDSEVSFVYEDKKYDIQVKNKTVLIQGESLTNKDVEEILKVIVQIRSQISEKSKK